MAVLLGLGDLFCQTGAYAFLQVLNLGRVRAFERVRLISDATAPHSLIHRDRRAPFICAPFSGRKDGGSHCLLNKPGQSFSLSNALDVAALGRPTASAQLLKHFDLLGRSYWMDIRHVRWHIDLAGSELWLARLALHAFGSSQIGLLINRPSLPAVYIGGSPRAS